MTGEMFVLCAIWSLLNCHMSVYAQVASGERRCRSWDL